MPLNELGFFKRNFAEILADKEQKARELFGEDIDTSELTPLGKFLRINAYDQAITEEEAENIYYSIFPSTATGQSLDRLCWTVGVTRNQATPSEYTVKVTGESGTTVPVGFLVGTDEELTFYNVEEATIGEEGTVEITVSCTQSGEIGNVSYTDIYKIVNPVTNISSVIGVSQVSTGTEVESDFSLRQRFEEAKEGLGSCNETSIKSALMRIPTVTSVGIAVNDTDSDDIDGRPARSFECYINGGTNYHQQIAEAIFEKKPIGIKTYGDVSQEVTDDGGYTHTINFSHTETISVYVRITISIDSTFSGDSSKQEIRNNLRDHINSLGVGKSTIISTLYEDIHSVSGVTEVSEIKLGTNGQTYLNKNITATAYQNCEYAGLQISTDGGTTYEEVT